MAADATFTNDFPMGKVWAALDAADQSRVINFAYARLSTHGIARDEDADTPAKRVAVAHYIRHLAERLGVLGDDDDDGTVPDFVLNALSSVNLRNRPRGLVFNDQEATASVVPGGGVTPPTPQDLPTASTTTAGIVELATEGEALQGADEGRAVTPHTLAAVINALPEPPTPEAPPAATTTTPGLVELATTDEATTGTDTERAVTPTGLSAAITEAVTDLQEATPENPRGYILPTGLDRLNRDLTFTENTVGAFDNENLQTDATASYTFNAQGTPIDGISHVNGNAIGESTEFTSAPVPVDGMNGFLGGLRVTMTMGTEAAWRRTIAARFLISTRPASNGADTHIIGLGVGLSGFSGLVALRSTAGSDDIELRGRGSTTGGFTSPITNSADDQPITVRVGDIVDIGLSFQSAGGNLRIVPVINRYRGAQAQSFRADDINTGLAISHFNFNQVVVFSRNRSNTERWPLAALDILSWKPTTPNTDLPSHGVLASRLTGHFPGRDGDAALGWYHATQVIGFRLRATLDANGITVGGKAIESGGTAGATRFTGLDDTPKDLGTAGQVVAVDDAGTALEFIDAPSGGGLTEAQVDGRVEAGVQDWAEAGNTDAIPAAKLTNAPAGTAEAAPVIKARWPGQGDPREARFSSPAATLYTDRQTADSDALPTGFTVDATGLHDSRMAADSAFGLNWLQTGINFDQVYARSIFENEAARSQVYFYLGQNVAARPGNEPIWERGIAAATTGILVGVWVGSPASGEQTPNNTTGTMWVVREDTNQYLTSAGAWQSSFVEVNSTFNAEGLLNSDGTENDFEVILLKNQLVIRVNSTEIVNVNMASVPDVSGDNFGLFMRYANNVDLTSDLPRTLKRVHIQDLTLFNILGEQSASGGGDVADGSITAAKLANRAVTTAKLADGAVTTAKIGNRQVTASKIALATIQNSHIVPATITANQLAGSSVTASKIADRSVTTTKIVDRAVTAAKLGSGSVTTAKIADGAITAAKLAPGVGGGGGGAARTPALLEQSPIFAQPNRFFELDITINADGLVFLGNFQPSTLSNHEDVSSAVNVLTGAEIIGLQNSLPNGIPNAQNHIRIHQFRQDSTDLTFSVGITSQNKLLVAGVSQNQQLHLRVIAT